MNTREEHMQKALFAKFDDDVRTKSRGLRALLAFDQLVGVVFWNNSQDETISSQIARRQMAGTATWWDNKVCCFLKKFEQGHCKKSLGE